MAQIFTDMLYSVTLYPKNASAFFNLCASRTSVAKRALCQQIKSQLF